VSITIKPAAGIAAWSFQDLTVAGQRVIEQPDAPLASAVAAAVAAGVLELVDGNVSMASVESDKQSLRKLRVADAARGPLFEQRDAELLQASPDTHEQLLDAYTQRMAAAAQAALEEEL
jgi:hypothetical protein